MMNPNQINKISPETIKQLLKNRKVLIAVTRRSFLCFFYIYFGSYIKYQIAPFHYKMFRFAQDESLKRVGIIAFRGSAKSTILNTAYTLWAVMGILQKKHVVIASQTQQRARDHLKNVRMEIEKNQLLRQNLGPFEETEDQWRVSALIVPRYGARITAISVEEGIRGLREGPHRPDLIIADDIEDSGSVKTKEGRDKTFGWLTGELLPLGDIDTKAVFIGNFLHEDSALMRIKKMMKENQMKGEFLRVPLLDEENNIAWPGMFPTLANVEEFKQGIGNEISWQREYLLKYVPDADQIIKPEDIQYYDVIPTQNYMENGEWMEIIKGRRGIGVDLAISQKDSADYTAIVQGQVIHFVVGKFDRNATIYIEPSPINERIDFHETMQLVKTIDKTTNGYGMFFVEDVAYQRVAVEEMTRHNLCVVPMRPDGDKRSRLQILANYIKSGKVVFPQKGCEQLIRQLVYFGMESHDDLVDALAYLVLGLAENGMSRSQIFSL